MLSREEINFRRLLTRCEAMASNIGQSDWRLEKYTEALQNQLTALRKCQSKPSQETLLSYTRRVDVLKGLLDAESKNSITSPPEVLPTPLSLVTQSKKSNKPSNELTFQTKARLHSDLRDELFKKLDNSGDVELRKRVVADERLNTQNSSPSTNANKQDIDTVIKHHREMQDKYAEEMVDLAKNLKENVRASGKVVTDDNKKLVESQRLADVNYSKLEKESRRLDEHVQRSCSCWIYLMLAVVCATFISMVMFMKLFPKK